MSRSLYRRTRELGQFLADLASREAALSAWPVRRSIVHRSTQTVTLFTALVRGVGPHRLQISWLEVPDAPDALLDGNAAQAELQIRLSGSEVEEGEWTVGDLRTLEPLVQVDG